MNHLTDQIDARTPEKISRIAELTVDELGRALPESGYAHPNDGSMLTLRTYPLHNGTEILIEQVFYFPQGGIQILLYRITQDGRVYRIDQFGKGMSEGIPASLVYSLLNPVDFDQYRMIYYGDVTGESGNYKHVALVPSVFRNRPKVFGFMQEVLARVGMGMNAMI